MNLTFKYDCEINNCMMIPEGTKVKQFESWSEYEGFTAFEYKGEKYYVSDHYFVEVRCPA
ncbi:hypothetical protein [uncultured Metabacillus sp.]|uniref:hypothetical protein n=1 Tax=Metabacillus sp. Hm71 TaxID=3450743 RepID=UPI00260D3C1B|nr:hypothetical protein [uncultured Metabacillus sp.]